MNDTSSTPQRDELRAKIEASERRIAERTVADQASEAAGAAKQYVKDNPMTVIGGAIAFGLVLGLMTKTGRNAAKNAASSTAGAVGGAASGAAKTVGTAAKKRGAAFGTLLADAIVAYGMKLIDDALDGARTGRDKLEDLSDDAAAKAREVKRDAEYFAGSAADKSRAVTQRTRRRAVRAVRDIKDRVSN
ncbi:hypothetical protein [Erythrobacter sp. YT30]|uniref:hypothetical protein n=1 Tax=Erythrobacter sp. YT30 TaxID=1735012 RepID=UPI00076D467D|nr:hypothetical protein [Erythrobacter sp. YT30]KWV92884.1 hypothetical protein AUC45_01685 [Erythrobacter sp. YT30]